MEEKQLQDMMPLGETLVPFNRLDDNDAVKMARCLNMLLFGTGFVDGTYEPDVEIYRFIQRNFNEIDRYLFFLGLRLLSDTDTRMVWLDVCPKDEGAIFSPFSPESMNLYQMVLLCVLQKRLAAGESSKDTGADGSTGVLVTRQDIFRDMAPYIRKGDEKYKADRCAEAVNRFVSRLGLLRVVAERFPVADGGYDTVYRINPFIQHHFDAVEMERLKLDVMAQGEAYKTLSAEGQDAPAEPDVFVEGEESDD